jgi:hypothetical protein
MRIPILWLSAIPETGVFRLINSDKVNLGVWLADSTVGGVPPN